MGNLNYSVQINAPILFLAKILFTGFINSMLNAVNTNIYNIPKIYVEHSNQQRLRFSPMSNGTVSFTSRDLLKKNPQEITIIVRKAINNANNLIGEGWHGLVYDIPETGYCVKVRINSIPTLAKWDFNISKKERINHIVAKSDDNTIIMKKIQGIPIGKLDDKTKEEIYDLPLDSYKNLILQIYNAHKKGLSIDSHQFNVIYNKDKKLLTQIDFDYERYEYSPFYDCFNELKSNGNIQQNIKLGENLLGLAAREISTNNKDNLPIFIRDIMKLYNNLYKSSYNSSKTDEYKTYIEEHLTIYKKFLFFFVQLKGRWSMLQLS